MSPAPSRWRGFGVPPGWAWPRRDGPPWLDTAPAYVPGTRSGTLLGWLAVGTAPRVPPSFHPRRKDRRGWSGVTGPRLFGPAQHASGRRMRRHASRNTGTRSGLERRPGYALRCPGARPAVRLVHRSRAAPDGDARGLGPSRPVADVERRRKSPRPEWPRWTTGPHGSRRHRGRKSPDRTTGRRKPTRMNPANRVRRANPGTGAGRRPGCCAPR